MDTFLSTLLTMSVTAALVAGIVMLLRLVLRPLPRWITCALWGVVFLRMICPVGLSLPVSLVPQAITSGAYVQHLLPAEPGPAQETVPVQDTPAPAEHTLSAGDGTPPAPAAPADIPRPALLTGVWATGAAATLLWAAVSYARLRRQVAEAVPVEKGVYESDRVSTPFVCGLLRPRIYLPASLPAEDRHYVLLHERAHLRRRDHWTKPLAYLALCLHWFNPLLWLAYRLFCRDVEAACAQAVIRPLGREDTARYAAPLLHLGCRSGFPAAVPLAFGTEDTKGRIRAVLSYRRPALWLILATAAACLAAGLFLLGDTNGRLEGRPVDEGMVFSYGETLPLPEPLLEELLALCNRYDGDLEPMSSLSFETDTRILLSGKKDHWEIFRGDHPLLVHTTSSGGKDRESQPYRMTGQLEQAYLAWEASLEEYLWVTRPDTLYTRRGCSLQTKQTAEQVLEELNLRAFTGPYTVEVFQGESPDPTILTVYLDTPPVLATDAARLIPYLDLASSALFALDDTLFYIDWTFGAQGSLHGTGSYMTYPDGLSGQDTPPQTQEAFRETYRQMKQAGSAAQITLFGRYRDTEQVLYCAPGYDGPFPLEAGRSHGIFSELWSDVFALTSFSDSQGVHYDTPYYRWQPQAANDQLTRYGVDPAQHQGEARWCIVENVFTQDTGYRLYEWDGNVFLGYTTPGQPAGPLSFLVQLESTPH